MARLAVAGRRETEMAGLLLMSVTPVEAEVGETAVTPVVEKEQLQEPETPLASQALWNVLCVAARMNACEAMKPTVVINAPLTTMAEAKNTLQQLNSVSMYQEGIGGVRQSAMELVRYLFTLEDEELVDKLADMLPEGGFELLKNKQLRQQLMGMYRMRSAPPADEEEAQPEDEE